MLLHGDEFGRTQTGNNNPYCQDNETCWTDWSLAVQNAGLLEFTARISTLRRAHLIFRRIRFFVGRPANTGRLVHRRLQRHPRLRLRRTSAWSVTRRPRAAGCEPKRLHRSACDRTDRQNGLFVALCGIVQRTGVTERLTVIIFLVCIVSVRGFSTGTSKSERYLLVEETCASGSMDGFDAVAGAEFAHDVFEVRFDGRGHD